MTEAKGGERDAARARLQAVRARFADRLAARVNELVDVIEAARGGRAELEEAASLAHRLAGTAGSFGYAEAGEHAASVEAALRGVQRGSVEWDALDRALAALRLHTP